MIGLKSTLNVCVALHSFLRLFTLFLQVIDNSGALLIECVNVLKNKVNNGWGSVGDEIVCVVQQARPVSAAAQATLSAVKVRRGDVRRAVIVRTRKAVRRPDGRWVRFDDNAAVLLNNKREMLGTRIGGVVSADLRMKGWGKIASLAPRVRPAVTAFALAHSYPSGCLIACLSYYHLLLRAYSLLPLKSPTGFKDLAYTIILSNEIPATYQATSVLFAPLRCLLRYCTMIEQTHTTGTSFWGMTSWYSMRSQLSA